MPRGEQLRTQTTLFPPEPAPARLATAEGLFAHVVVQRPVRTEFTYRLPPQMAAAVRPGVRVAVHFGGQREVAVVVGLADRTHLSEAQVRPLAEVLDEEPLLDRELLELTRWMAEHYACSWGEALHAVLPSALKRERRRATVAMVRAAEGVGPEQLVALEAKAPQQHRALRTLLEIAGAIELRELTRQLQVSPASVRGLAGRGLAVLEHVLSGSDPLALARPAAGRGRPERLFAQQQEAVERIVARLESGGAGSFLLQGVTGSGKTEVYLAAIERALALGRGAIVLVPEIALTPQTVGWFRARFDKVAVLHSRMTEAQRLDAWLAVLHGEARVVVGARSAVFAPVSDLGVIVVDEEHEPSFKQDHAPRYHARDVALRRAQLCGAVCVLGSATPSLESWHAARTGVHVRLELTERAGGRPLPPVEVVDLSRERGGEAGGTFSARLAELLRATMQRGEQAILFQNRRGWAPVLWCKGCRSTVRCPQCDVGLTWHKRPGRMLCHACCGESPPPVACPLCTRPGLRFLGAGSERIEQELAQLLPGARVQRMDSDTMRRREDFERALEAFGKREVDVLVGTQMIAKGLDFPGVTLVGIVHADSALHLPDFRASERTFQLVAQVAGRAGRGGIAGRIVVQTMLPEHPAIVSAAKHDFEGFAAGEDRLRAELGYPPHGRLVRVVLEDEDEELLGSRARELGEGLRAGLEGTGVEVLGPAPAPIARLRNRERVHLLLKAGNEEGLARAREVVLGLVEGKGRPKVVVDVDPAGML